MTIKDALDTGEANSIGPAFKTAKVGTILYGGALPVRMHRESRPVASDAATPSHAILRLLYAKVSGGSGGHGEKAAQVNGAAVAANSAAPNAAGTSVAFTAAEVAGASAVVDMVYLTAEPPKDAKALDAQLGGGIF
jgi:hypothetical protein